MTQENCKKAILEEMQHLVDDNEYKISDEDKYVVDLLFGNRRSKWIKSKDGSPKDFTRIRRKVDAKKIEDAKCPWLKLMLSVAYDYGIVIDGMIYCMMPLIRIGVDVLLDREYEVMDAKEFTIEEQKDIRQRIKKYCLGDNRSSIFTYYVYKQMKKSGYMRELTLSLKSLIKQTAIIMSTHPELFKTTGSILTFMMPDIKINVEDNMSYMINLAQMASNIMHKELKGKQKKKDKPKVEISYKSKVK